MADEAKKLSTQEILAAARAQAGQGGGAAPAKPKPAPAVEAPAPAVAAGETTAVEAAAPVAPTPAAKPAGATPTSTAEILAAARAAAAAKKAGGEAPAGEAAAKPKAPVAAKPASGKPTSTADILAAARAAAAAKAGGAPAASAGPAAEKPAAKAKASPKAPAAKAAAGSEAAESKLSVQEMLAAVRPTTVAAATARLPKKADLEVTVPPPLPAKPIVAKKPKVDEQRRSVLWTIFVAPFASAFALAWTSLAAVTAISTLATARMMLPNVLTEPPRKFKIGPPSDYDLGTVATKWVAQYGIWVVHTDQYKGRESIYALISVCTHLGCTPSWLEGEQKFKCPCHGSGFYISGVNFEGPAPRPLERAGIRLSEDGMLEVDKSVKFQEEMGQWEDGNSYVEIA